MDPLPVIELTELTGNQIPELSPLQQLLEPAVDSITLFWFALWVCTACTLFAIVVREYRAKRGDTADLD